MPQMTRAEVERVAADYLRERRIDAHGPLHPPTFWDAESVETLIRDMEAEGWPDVDALRRGRAKLVGQWSVGYKRRRVGWWRRLVGDMRGTPMSVQYVMLSVDDATGVVSQA